MRPTQTDNIPESPLTRPAHTLSPTGGAGQGSAIELSDAARVNLLPLPARNERGEGWGEGKLEQKSPSSPRPSPPAAGGEGGQFALSAVSSRNSTAVGPG